MTCTGTLLGDVTVAAAPGTKVNPVIAPPDYAMYSYDCTNVLAQAIRNIGLDDLLGELEHDGGLIAVVRSGINLAMHHRFGADQMRQDNRGDQRRLAVLARHRQDRAPHRLVQDAVAGQASHRLGVGERGP